MYSVTLKLTPAGTEMLDFIQNLSTPQILLGVAVLAVLYNYNKDWIKDLINKDPTPGPALDIYPNADPDYLDFQALKRLAERGERLQCPQFNEGLAMVKANFFHSHPIPTPTTQ